MRTFGVRPAPGHRARNVASTRVRGTAWFVVRNLVGLPMGSSVAGDLDVPPLEQRRLPIPPDEDQRVGSLLRYRVLDTGDEAAFDELVELTASLMDTRIAAIALIDGERLWFKAKV